MFSLKSGTQVLEYVLWGDIMKPEVTSQNGKKTFQRKEKSGNGTSVIRRKGTGSITRCQPVISALGRRAPEDSEFRVILK